MDDADVSCRIHGCTREVAAQFLLTAESEAKSQIGKVYEIGLRAPALKVAGLALNEQLGSTEVPRGADLVDILSVGDDDPNIVGVAEDCAMIVGCRPSGHGCDDSRDAVSDILGLDLGWKDLAFKFGLRVARDVVG